MFYYPVLFSCKIYNYVLNSLMLLSDLRNSLLWLLTLIQNIDIEFYGMK